MILHSFGAEYVLQDFYGVTHVSVAIPRMPFEGETKKCV